jgi:hypothetical protein
MCLPKRREAARTTRHHIPGYSYLNLNPDYAVGIATGYGLDD